MARITHVTYQQVKVIRQYETQRIEATAEVDVLEDPHDVLKALRSWVQAELLGVKPNEQAFVPYSKRDNR